jgi:hypothetical protein
VDEPQVTHSSHEDRLDDNRRTPPRVPPIRQGINMDRQQERFLLNRDRWRGQ